MKNNFFLGIGLGALIVVASAVAAVETLKGEKK